MTTPEQLDRMIDATFKGEAIAPQTPEEKLTVSLIKLAGDFQIDSAFDATLRNQLRQTPVPRRKVMTINHRSVRLFAVSAASLVALFAAVLAIPPLRTLAQEVLEYFVVGQPETPPTNAVRDTVSLYTATLEEAEAIGGFEALEIDDPRFTLRTIQASEGFINLYYIASEESGFVNLVLSQWIEPYKGLNQIMIPPEASIQHVNVNENPAEYASGAWNFPRGIGEEWVWVPDQLGILRWKQDDVNFILNINPADTAEMLVAIAEGIH